MAIIRKIEIENLRCIKSLSWIPSEGINCLIGPGDSGKSTILDAIDLCLGARRTAQIGDADFLGMDVTRPISISITIGNLDDSLKSIETYGQFLRSFDVVTGNVEDEPEKDGETVLTVNFRVESDLEPVWSLVSERAAQQGITKTLNWRDKQRIAPTRLGTQAGFNLSWTRGSVLNRLSEEKTTINVALVEAAREARTTFGDQAGKQLNDTLETVAKAARELGIPVGGSVKALLDAHAVSFSDGAISLHNEAGVPLRNLGTGSTRLLVAGLQRQAAESASVILIDELEYGLEPHRLIRLLGSLGAKEKSPPLQVFMTTHSPVAVRELTGNQLFVVRRKDDGHQVLRAGTDDDIQSTMRRDPEAFLATTVVVCEGASEVGFVRGLDEFRLSKGLPALTASAVALVDVGGGKADSCFYRGKVFQRLGYRVLALLDNDKAPTPEVMDEFVAAGGKVIAWRERRALEDEFFLSSPDTVIETLLDYALELTTEGLVDSNLKSSSNGTTSLEKIRLEGLLGKYSVETRVLIGQASRMRKSGWFKSITKMEAVARDIIGPNLEQVDPAFKALIDDMFGWAHGQA